MDNLPIEILHNISLFISLNDIISLSSISKKYKFCITDNDLFWRIRFIEDFSDYRVDVKSWKNKYKKFWYLLIFPIINSPQFNDIEKRNILRQIFKINIKQISIYKHILLLDKENNVWGYGENKFHELGLSKGIYIKDFTLIPNIKAKYVSAVYKHSVFLDINNNVWACGCKFSNRVGDEIYNNTYSNVLYVPTIILRKVESNYEPIKVKEISAGMSHTLMLDINNNVSTIGKNDSYGSANVYLYSYHDKKIKGKHITCNSCNNFIIDINDNVWYFGNNIFKKNIKSPIMIDNIKAKKIIIGDSDCFIIDLDNNVWVCGTNEYCQLILSDKDITNFKQIPNIKAKNIIISDYSTILIDMSDDLFLYGIKRNFLKMDI